MLIKKVISQMMLSFKILMQHHYWLQRFLMNGNLSLTLFPGSLFFPSSPLGAPLGCSRGHEEDTEIPGVDLGGLKGMQPPQPPLDPPLECSRGQTQRLGVLKGMQPPQPSTLDPPMEWSMGQEDDSDSRGGSRGGRGLRRLQPPFL